MQGECTVRSMQHVHRYARCMHNGSADYAAKACAVCIRSRQAMSALLLCNHSSGRSNADLFELDNAPFEQLLDPGWGAGGFSVVSPTEDNGRSLPACACRGSRCACLLTCTICLPAPWSQGTCTHILPVALVLLLSKRIEVSGLAHSPVCCACQGDVTEILTDMKLCSLCKKSWHASQATPLCLVRLCRLCKDCNDKEGKLMSIRRSTSMQCKAGKILQEFNGVIQSSTQSLRTTVHPDNFPVMGALKMWTPSCCMMQLGDHAETH